MASNVKNDEEEQLFYSKEMIQSVGARTILMGVVDSKSFADSEVDYFVGKGGLAGIIGVPPALFEGISACVNERWTLLQEKAGLQETQKERSLPMFCWVDSIRPLITAGAQKAEWLEIDDLVGPLSKESDDEHSLFPGIPRAGLALLLKICGALAEMGHPPEVIRSVGALVKRNLMTVAHFESLPLETQSAPGKEEWIEMRIRAMLTSILDSKGKETRTINMNSNEPVLLINNFGALRHELVRDIIRLTMEQLHQIWNVWPVRVYAGPFMVGQVSDEFRQSGFSITLLNVVNTDIGGPSMIDLLDQASDAPIWSYGFNSFFKEMWRDRQLVDKFETEAPISPSSSSDSISRQSQVSAMSETPIPQQSASGPQVVEENPADEIPKEVQRREDEDAVPAAVEVVEAEVAGPSKSSRAMADAPGDDETMWDDVRARFDSHDLGRSVKHPTFEHATSRESLLDLIRSQAEVAEKPTDIEEMEAVLKSTTEQTRNASEDEFVVV